MARDFPARRVRICALVDVIAEACEADFQEHTAEAGNLNVALTALTSVLANVVERIEPAAMRDHARAWIADALAHPERRIGPDAYLGSTH